MCEKVFDMLERSTDFEYKRTIVLVCREHSSPGSYLVVCTHIQHDRQTLLWWHPPAGCVEGQFAYWDAHSVTA